MNNLYLNNFMYLISTTDKLNEQSFLDELFKFKNQVLEIKSNSEHHLNLHPFKLNNKYYDADINFVVLNDQKGFKSDFIDQVEVLGILFDIEQDNFLAKIEEIYSKFDNLQEKILICKSTNPEMKNDHLLNWCCVNKFELVDLNESKEEVDEDDELDEVIQEKFGFNRFVEILDTHNWPNIQFKDEQNNLNDQSCSDLRSEIKEDNLVDNYFRELTLNENGKNSEDLDEKKLTFEELFSQIREFKEKADQLIGDDKYNYAEKVAMAFLNSLDEDD